MNDHVLVGYSELKGIKSTEKDLTEIIKSFRRDSTFHYLTTINNFVSLFPPNFNKGKSFIDIQRFLSANLLDDEIWNLTNEKLTNSTPLERPIFSRWQILFLMKKVLLESPVDGKVDLSSEENKEARFLLGKACLFVNDLLTTEEQDQITTSDNPGTDSERERVLTELLTQMLPMSELMNPSESSRALLRSSKYLKISKKYFAKFLGDKSLSEYFESLVGIDLETFLDMVLLIETWFIIQEVEDLQQNPQNFNLDRNTWFSNLTYSEEQISSFFKLASSNDLNVISELKNLEDGGLSPQYDFRVFRKYPLFFLTDRIFTTIDYELLTEKVSFGLYHTILNALPKDNQIRRSFFQHWGKVFEIYINSVFREIYPEISKRFFPNTFFEHKNEMEAFDGIIEYPARLLVIEYKSGMLNSNAKYSGNKDALLVDLNKKFGLEKNDSGVKQILRKIELLYHSDPTKRLGVRGLKFENVKFIYPMLIVNETSLEFGLATWKLRNWFEQELGNRKIDEEVLVKSLIVLTVVDLEMVTQYIDAGDFTLIEFVEFYAGALTTKWFHPMIGVREIFTNFRNFKNIDFRPHEKSTIEFNNYVDEIVRKRFKNQEEIEN